MIYLKATIEPSDSIMGKFFYGVTFTDDDTQSGVSGYAQSYPEALSKVKEAIDERHP